MASVILTEAFLKWNYILLIDIRFLKLRLYLKSRLWCISGMDFLSIIFSFITLEMLRCWIPEAFLSPSFEFVSLFLAEQDFKYDGCEKKEQKNNNKNVFNWCE